MKRKWFYLTLSFLPVAVSASCFQTQKIEPKEDEKPENPTTPENPGTVDPKEQNGEIGKSYDFNVPISNLTVNLRDYTTRWKKSSDSLYYKFFEDIVESAKNDIPSVLLNRNAAQVFISSFMSMIAQLELSKNDPAKYNDVLYMLDQLVWDYYQKDASTNRFDLNFLLKKYQDIISDKEINTDSGKLWILGNTKYISGIDRPYNIFPQSLEELLDYLKPYLDKGIELFDFFIPDISFIKMNRQQRHWIIKHANKITLLSDGNAQPYTFIRDNYIKWVKNQKESYSEAELLKFWNEYKQSEGLEMPIDYHFFYTLSDKIRIFNLNNGYMQPLNDDLEKRGFGWAKLNVYAYPLNPETFYEYLEINDENNVRNDYLTVNKLKNKSFLDLVVDGKNNYNPNKKNLVFMGSSLFRKTNDDEWRFQTQKYALDEIHEFFAKINELYPQDEYNYFFKLHPVYNLEESKIYLNYLLGEQANKAILLDSGIAWENMLVVDYENIANGSSVLFTPDGKSKTQLYGLQGTTTTLLATMTFLKESFGWNNKEIKSFVNLANFPLSNKFNIIKRDIEYENPDQGYQENVAKMKEVYRYFITSGDFPGPKEWIDMRTFLKRQN